MEVYVHADGTRARPFGTPYIDRSECYYQLPLYNPNGQGHRDGVYDYPFGQQPCKCWSSGFQHFRTCHPSVKPSAMYTPCTGVVKLQPQYRC